MKRSFEDDDEPADAQIRNRGKGFTDQELESRFSSQTGDSTEGKLMDEATIRKLMKQEREKKKSPSPPPKKKSRWENRRAEVIEEPSPSIGLKSPSPQKKSPSPPPKKSRWGGRAEVREESPSTVLKSPSPPPKLKKSRWENRRAEVVDESAAGGESSPGGAPSSSVPQQTAEARARASAGAAASMSPGDLVALHGLKAAAHLNGEKARLVRLDESSGRWEVSILRTKESKAIKPDNLAPQESDDEDDIAAAGEGELPSWAPRSPEPLPGSSGSSAEAFDPPVAPASPPQQASPMMMSGRALSGVAGLASGSQLGLPTVAQQFAALPRVHRPKPARSMGTIRWYNGRRKLGVIIPDSGGGDLFIPAQGASNGSQVPPQPAGMFHGTRVSYIPTAIKSESKPGADKQIVCMDVRALGGQTGLSVGVDTLIGGKEKNDDRIAATDLHELGFLAGIFDGHLGANCAEFVAKQVPAAILSSYRSRLQRDGGKGGMSKLTYPQEAKIIEKSFVDAFDEVDKAYLVSARKKEWRDGSTGIVALVSHGFEVPVTLQTAASLWPPDKNAAAKQPGTVARAPGGVAKLFVAWCGDSRCVLLRGKTGLRISEDHRPSRRDEQSRAKAAGGMVAQDGHGIWRVGPRQENKYAKELEKNKKSKSAAMKMWLSTSRSFGDLALKVPDPVIISTPDVKVIDLVPEDWAVMIGCDGIFDVLSDQAVANVLFKAMAVDGKDPVAASKDVTQAAFRAGSRDNLTAIVMRLGWAYPPAETGVVVPAAAGAPAEEEKKDEFNMFG